VSQQKRKPSKEVRELRAELAQTRRASVLMRRSMEAATTIRLNRAHWGSVGSGGPADALFLPDLAITRSRCIWETLNAAYAAGIQRSHAEDCIGPTGPGLQIQVALDPQATEREKTVAAKFTHRLERAWRRWAANPDLRRQASLVDLMQQADGLLTSSGEYFFQKVTDRTFSGPVKQRLLPIHPARIATPPSEISNPDVRNGIIVDANGTPLFFYIAKAQPGVLSGLAWSVTDFEKVPATDMLHGYQELLPGQTRGWPRLAPTLGLGALHRDFMNATLEAAATAARISAILENTNPNADPGAVADGENPVVEMESGQLLELDPFLKAVQMHPEHPPTTLEMFHKILLAQMGRPFGMPYFKVALDSSGFNYSSVRMDNQSYWKGIACDQVRFARQMLAGLLADLLRELALAEDLAEPEEWSAVWQWPRPEHVDPLKEASAAETRKRIRTTTDADEIGPDWEEVYTQQAREMSSRLAAFRAAGLPIEILLAEIAASGESGKALAAALLALDEKENEPDGTPPAAPAKPTNGTQPRRRAVNAS